MLGVRSAQLRAAGSGSPVPGLCGPGLLLWLPGLPAGTAISRRRVLPSYIAQTMAGIACLPSLVATALLLQAYDKVSDAGSQTAGGF